MQGNKSETKQDAKPKRTPAEIEADRAERKARKAEKLAKIYANGPDQFQNIGNVMGSTPRGHTRDDDKRQSLRHIKASKWKRDRDVHKLSNYMSKRPGEYETVADQGGFHDFSRWWWKQAVPDFPSDRDTPAHMRTDNAAQRGTFQAHRTRNRGIQAPRRP